ncbi:MAG: tetratricopeptide repeat protein [Bacteriovoracia bacterium]
MAPRDDDENLNEGTRVDLAEDLLRTSPSLGATPSSTTKQIDLDDSVQSARILVNEGLIEEAKRTLWRILRDDASHVVARELLEEIHELELKQLFDENSPRRERRGRRRGEPEHWDTESIIAELDESLGLQLDDGGDTLLAQLFKDDRDVREFKRRLDEDLASLAAPERLDVGIAYFQMGLPDIAFAQFDAVRKTSTDGDLIYISTTLVAQAQLAMRKPFEALVSLEAFLGSSDLSSDQKLNLYYLMGVAHQQIGSAPEAMSCFEWVAHADPRYRDVQDRLNQLRGNRPRS